MDRRGWGIALFLLTAAAYALAGWRAVLAHTDLTEMDTVAYLDAALQIRQTGGILHHLPNLIRGVYTEATQHPLYLLLLSPFAENSTRFFVTAKLTSYAVGFVFLTVFFMAVRRQFGSTAAGAAGWLWVMSAGFLTLVTTVACEGLLGVWVAAFWWALIAGRGDRRWWAAAGLCAGFAFLTKSIGILLLPVFALSAFWWDRRALAPLVRSRAFWSFFAVFAVTASPLFIRNVVVYGSPLYSDSSGVLWVDRWDEFSLERAAEGRFTLMRYLSSHTPGQILQIFWDGVVRRNPLMVVESLKPLPFWRPLDPDLLRGFYHPTVPWQGIWALTVALFAAAGWWKHRRHAAAAPTLALWIIFGIFVGWYSKIFPNTPPARLLYPALIFVPVYAALGLQAAAGALRSAARPGFAGPSAAAVLLSVTIGGLFLHGSWIGSDVRKSFDFPGVFKVQMALTEALAKKGDRVLVGDNFASHLFYLKGQHRAEYLAWPKVDGMRQAIEWMRRENVRYAVVDLATALYNPQVFGAYYRVERPGVLRPLQPIPAPLQRIPRDPRIPPVFDLYQVT